MATTPGYLGNAVYELNVVMDKTGVRPLEVQIVADKGGSLPATALMAALGSGKNYYFAKLSKT